MKVIDADNMIVGRLASEVAKDLLNGEEVRVINAEKAVISGDPVYTLNIYKQRLQRGDPYKGPFFPKHPDRILKRAIRGMLPHRKPRGSEAYKRLKVFMEFPEEFKNEKIHKIPSAANNNKKFITLENLAKKIGGA